MKDRAERGVLALTSLTFSGVEMTMPKLPQSTAHRGIPFELMFGRRKRRDQRPALRISTRDDRRKPACPSALRQRFGGFGEDIQIRTKLRNQFRTALINTDRVTDWSEVDVEHLIGRASINAA